MKAIGAVKELRTLLDAGAIGGMTDGQLLDAFLARRDEAAFEALVHRHGPMVWGVCRRILRDHHDAQDAFQASFLVLARRAAKVSPRDRVGNWLYGVACRTAKKAGAVKARTRGREAPLSDVVAPGTASREDDRLPELDRQLGRLPEKYRVPLLLCALEGLSHEEAAARLGCPIGTLSSRLTRARSMLARRLAVPVGTLGLVLAATPAPASVIASTARGAIRPAGVFSSEVVSLAERVIRAMMFSRFSAVTGGILAIALISGGWTLASRSASRAKEDAPAGPLPAPIQAESPPPAKLAIPIRGSKPGHLGRWKVVRYQMDGRPFEGQKLERISLELGDGTYRFPWALGPVGADRGSYRVDLAKTPNEIDFVPDSGPFKGLIEKGIFEVEGDTLTICVAYPTKDRPSGFVSSPNSAVGLGVFRRDGGGEDNVAENRPAETLEGLVAKVLEAHGGEARLAGLKAFRETIRETDGGRSTTTVHYLGSPGQYRAEINYGDGNPLLVCILTPNGMRRWYKHPDGRSEEAHFTGAEMTIEAWRETLTYFGPRRILRLRAPDHRLTVVPEAGGRDVSAIRMVKDTPPIKMDATLSFDRTTHLLVGESVPSSDVATTYVDYKTFGGFPIPRKTTRARDKGKETTLVEVLDFRVLEDPDRALFEKP